MRRRMQRQARKQIKSDAVNKTVIPEKQAVHIRNSGSYIQGRSYLLDGVCAQSLVDKYHGTGWIVIDGMGVWHREVVKADQYIGVNVNRDTLEETLTDLFVIHYRKTGTHIVPTLKGVIDL